MRTLWPHTVLGQGTEFKEQQCCLCTFYSYSYFYCDYNDNDAEQQQQQENCLDCGGLPRYKTYICIYR